MLKNGVIIWLFWPIFIDLSSGRLPKSHVAFHLRMDIQPSNPLASTICTIEDIVKDSAGYKDRKVRFLGWYDTCWVCWCSVDAYDIDTAIVTLVHCSQSVQVDVSLLVEGLRFATGEWLNVIGYLEHIQTEKSTQYVVKAVMVLGVSPGFDLIQYENTVKSRTQAIF